MKLIQDNGQPRFGRFTQSPDEINAFDYINPFLKYQWQRKLRYKTFSFIGIQHRQYSIGLAIVDLAWVGHGFYYCYDRTTQKFVDYHALQPLGKQTVLHDLTQLQRSYFKHKNISIEFKQNIDTRQIRVERKGELLCRATIQRNQGQPLYLSSPTGIRGWTFTHKSMCLPISGQFLFQGKSVDFDAASLATLDDSCGFLRPETEWFWLSCQCVINGKKIGINLASGVNESCGNENCLWVDGVLYALPDVIFSPLDQERWHIYSLDGQLDLRVRTDWRRYENKGLFLVASQFSQWIAVLNGKISVGQENCHFDRVHALLEQHYARW